MKLNLLKPFKSIRHFDAFELPDFVVLTGVNGAGKSHLLEAIENGSIVIDGVPPNTPHGQKFIRRFDANTLVTQDTGAFSGSQISQEVASMWDQLQQTWQANFENFYMPLRQFPFGDVEKYTPQDLMEFDDTKLISMGFSQDLAKNAVETINSQINQHNTILTQNFIAQDPQNRPRILERLVSDFAKPFLTISQDEFYERFPDNWQQIDLFQQSFSRMFSAYQRAWRDNELRIQGKELGAKVTPLSQEEFVQKYGIPPWDFLNNILQIANLDFRINHPPQWEDRPYEPLLKDAKRGIEVKFANLSSGERVLMSFALCLYHVNDSRANIEYPKVLLFDEIDAPLHPSMTSSLLKTIQQSLVVDRGIKVILTTHSPSTVALSPESGIFVMHKAGAQRITTGSKDAALGILTSGVPTLSVNYENRRQVFVESKYDAEFYGAIFQLARPKLVPEVSLAFIGSGAGAGNGNCDQVIAIATTLRKAGNRTVLGLIDWDTQNKSSEHVHVLGENHRYAVENYILDPLFIGLLLLREKFVRPDYFGLEKDRSYLSIIQSGAGDLEIIAKQVVADLIKNLDAKEVNNTAPWDFHYSESFTISHPRWLPLLQGHRLEAAIKQTYPSLQRFKAEPDLKKNVIAKILDDRPGLIPSSIIETLKKIQEAK